MLFSKTICFLVACLCFASAKYKDEYTDEKRPYEFGFNIENFQHRHEKKDEKGIIMGEFGFITADGIYHVTVYATDEDGNFKIVSMKNVRVGPSPYGPKPSTTSSTTTTTTSRPIINQDPLYPNTLQHRPHPQDSEQTGVAAQPTARPYQDLTTPKTLPIPACSSCRIPEPPKPPAPSVLPPSIPNRFNPSNPISNNSPGIFSSGLNKPGVNPTYPSYNSVSSAPGLNPQFPRPNNPIAPIKPSLPSFNPITPINPFNNNPSSNPNNPNTPSNSFASSSLPSINPNKPPTPTNPFTNNPSFNPNNPNTPSNPIANPSLPSLNPNKPLTPTNPFANKPNLPSPNPSYPNPSGSISPNKPNLPSFGATPSNQNYPNSPGLPQQSPVFPNNNSPGTTFNSQNPPTSNTFPSPSNPNNYNPVAAGINTGVNPGGPILTSAVVRPVSNPGSIPSVSGQPGLPSGLTTQDMMDLLYKFNYTVGFHGHNEQGYRNGAKEGKYFVNNRDGIGRHVQYLANEFGYQPNITLHDLQGEDIPKEETEKNYGLKGYEFKWFNIINHTE